MENYPGFWQETDKEDFRERTIYRGVVRVEKGMATYIQTLPSLGNHLCFLA
jgi:hypothetical protein